MSFRKQTGPELQFQTMLTAVGGIPADDIEREFKFHPTRAWRSDFYIPKANMLLEVEGGTRGGGKSRHTSYHGYQGDCTKYSYASTLGYILIRTTPDHQHMLNMATLAGNTYRRILEEQK